MPYFSLKACSLWLAALACLLAAPAGATPITYELVAVGNPGNANDTGGTGNGAVAYDYQIGKYDVTIGQYTAFLNAVAKTDTYSLYDSEMETNGNIKGISRTGGSGSYTYSVVGSANRPITFVSWWDSARFANWMANGQPTGAQTSTTTENGAYNVTGENGYYAVAQNATNPNTGDAPTFYIPTENEWYKSAYYSPNYGGAGVPGYYAYATQSDTAPGNVVGSVANQANSSVSVFSVTQAGGYDASQNYLTDVGAFSGSGSFYGTFDQSGNVYQWNSDGPQSFSRRIRGGYWDGGYTTLSSGSISSCNPKIGFYALGIRLASPVSGSAVPEIDPNGLSAVLGLIVGGLGLLERRRYGRCRFPLGVVPSGKDA